MTHNLRFYLGFNLTNGIGAARLARLVDYFGSVEAAWEAPIAELSVSGLDAKSCASLAQTRRTIDLDAEMERAARLGVELLCLESEAYPALLRHIPQPPPLLYMRGSLAPADEWALAMVGTRGPSLYGKEVARRLAGELAAAGITVVSGLALGIDTLVHEAALEAGGRTVAVLGCGVDIAYPWANKQLAEHIAERGALVSEYPLGTKPAAPNFPPRNRVISGLSLGTLVVEAGERSGALITVTYALEQGREVFAVPGSIFNRTSDGPNRLIRDGAALVTSARDVLDSLNWTSAAAQQEAKQAIPDDPSEARLLELLSFEPQHVDELGRASDLSAAEVSTFLTLMELKGTVRQAGGMQYVLARETRAHYEVPL